MPACWSYSRVSTGRQASADRSGLQRQEQALAEWLTSHPDHQLQEALLDAGLSGSGAHRSKGALGQFINAAKAGTVPSGSVLIVESISRFSREVERQVLGVLLNDFWENGLGLAICGHDEIYTAELIDAQPHRLHVLLALMQQSRAEWLEKSRRSKGAKAAARAKQDQGIRTNGRVPWFILKDSNNKALRNEAGLFQLNPAHVETISLMVQMCLAGNGGRNIALLLNEQQRPARKGRCWTGEAVNQVLRDPSIKGTLTRKAGPVDHYWPAVIEAATFQQVRDAMTQRTFNQTTLKGNASALGNLFSGVAKCSVCDGSISFFKSGAISAGRRSYVSCRNAIRLKQCTAKRYHPCEPYEATGLAMLSHAQWQQLLARPDDDAELATLRQHYQQVSSAVINAQQALANAERQAEDAFIAGASEERLATIERALSRLRTQLQESQQEQAQLQLKLSTAEARPSSADQAQLLADRLAEYRRNLNNPEQRRSFNRWLQSRQPPIRLLLHPNGQLQLKVGEHLGQLTEIDSVLATIVNTTPGAAGLSGRGFQVPDDGLEDPDSLLAFMAEPNPDPPD